MSYVLNKNGVITGCLHSFCLACDCLFTNGVEIEEHTKTSAHSVNLSLFPYLDKFEGHCIRKFKTGYFCEFCNVILLTAVKVNLHTAKEDHKQKRGSHLLKNVDGDVKAFNNILIKESVWHGFRANGCSICDIEYVNEDDHKKETNHILNLIQKPIKFGANDAIYRQIDLSTIHCMTCNLLLTSNTSSEHFNNADHLKIYADCKIDIKTNGYVEDKEPKQIDENKATSKVKENNELDEKNGDNGLSKIVASTSILQSMNININLETETAFCRKCLLDVQFDYNAINTHIQSHSQFGEDSSALSYPSNIDKTKFNPSSDKKTNDDNHNDTEKGHKHIKVLPQIQNPVNNDYDCIENVNKNKNNGTKNEKYLSEFAIKHKINYKGGNNNAFCRTCKVNLPMSMACFKEHVYGLKHMKKTELLLKRKKMIDFIHSAKPIPHVPGREFLDVIINGEYCLNSLSFYFVVAIPDNGDTCILRCLLCETQVATNIKLPFYKRQLEAHTHNSTPHDLTMGKIPVITSITDEFVREIRPGSFHCGYCNIVVKTWVNMEEHLDSDAHDTTKVIQVSHLQDARMTAARILLSRFNHFRI